MISIIKKMRKLGEKEDKRRALIGSKDLRFNENKITPILAYDRCRRRCGQKGAVSTRQPCYLILMFGT
jgi:hypothetical protein